MNEITKISAVFNVKKSLVVHTENWMDEVFELISYRIIPDTQDLWKKDDRFKKLVKSRKNIQEQIDKYINEHG
jgi:hypothetical protein